MRRTLIGLLALATTAGLLSGCAPKRPVLYAVEDFRGRDIREAGAGYVLPAGIDIKPVIQDFVAAFDGDPGEGESLLRAELEACLEGDTPLLRAAGSTRQRLDLVDLTSVLPLESGRWLVLNEDKYGLKIPEVRDVALLRETLAEAGLEYLVVLFDLVVGRDLKSVPGTVIPTANGGMLYSPGSTSQAPTLYGQMLILDRDGQRIWQGYMHGSHTVGFRFTEGTVEGLAYEFARDVLDVLN